VAVLVVVNSLGNVLDADRTILAGPRSDDGSFVPYEVLVGQSPDRVGLNTVLTVAVTDLNIDRDLLYHIARSCNAGVAQTVVPAHTLWDGDTAFAVSTRKAGTLPREMAFDLGVIFSQLTAKAIRQAAKEARSVAGIPALTDLRR
jgi:L-aminopeptidase/D-esterase-like protein